MSLWPPRREDQAKLVLRSGASPKGRSGRQTKSGASGSEVLAAGEHVPDRVGKAGGRCRPGRPWPRAVCRAAACCADSARSRRGGEARASSPRAGPSAGRWARACESGPRRSDSPDWTTRGQRPGVAGELLRAGEALDLADLGGDREGQHPADPRGAHQQRDVGVIGVAGSKAAVGVVDLAVEVVDQLQRGGDVRRARARGRRAVPAAFGPRPRTGR